MKKIIGGLLILIFAILILLPYLKSQTTKNYHYRQFSDVKELQEYLAYSPGKIPLIGAHRGGPEKNYPENAIETFQRNLVYSPCLIECDVRKTADGELVMMHDETLDRTTTGSGRVDEMELADLKKLYLKDPEGEETSFRIPTLDEVLKWASGKAIIELDIKRGVTPPEIFAAIERNQALAYTVVITYNLEQLNTYQALHPDLMISAAAASVEAVERILETGIDPSRLLVFVGVSEPDPAVYRSLHQEGIRSILGTMHNIDNAALKRGTSVYRKVLDNGADILATDNVPLASEAIRQFMKQRSE